MGVFMIPKIDPVPANIPRPLWSVIIPAFERTAYLETAICSVLAQGYAPEEMQIEVVDNHSQSRQIQTIVERLGGGRIAYYYSEKTLTMQENWSFCLRRAKGLWVHLLHDDDFVLPGFYKRMEVAFSETAVGAAFCRHCYTNEQGQETGKSPLESETAGILPDFLDKISSYQVVQCPSIVVKREVYEKLGGFRKDLVYAGDWEMWVRIANSFPVWYEPEPLACYRVHKKNVTAQVFSDSGKSIAYCRKAIHIFKRYLPNSKKDNAKAAYKNYAYFGSRQCRESLNKGDLLAASKEFKETVITAICGRSIRPILRLTVVFLIRSVWLILTGSGWRKKFMNRPHNGETRL